MVREGLNLQVATEKAKGVTPQSDSPVAYDTEGNLLPPTRSLRTTKDQVVYMRAIRKSMGVEE